MELAPGDAERAVIRDRAEIPIDALGSGSDYTVFLDFLQVASLDFGFGGDSGGGIYHSVYDSYYWFTHFSDGEFTHTAALSQTIGTALLRLADAEVLPFEFRGSAFTLRSYVDDIARMPGVATKLDLSPVRSALSRLAASADAYEKALGKLARLDAAAPARPKQPLRELNELLYSTERAFRYEPGLPRRDWFKHLAYAPGFYTGYGVKTLPGIREGIEQAQWDEARSFIPIVAGAVLKLSGDVDRATDMLKKIRR
jgi:N-acetylated-alpha-linked acidic dipeptidase